MQAGWGGVLRARQLSRWASLCPRRSGEVTDPEPVLPTCAGRGSGPVSEGRSHLSHRSQPWEAGGPPHPVLVTPGVCRPALFLGGL